MTHYSGVAFISHWERFTIKPEKNATLKSARPWSWRTSLPLKFIMFRSGEARGRWTHRWRAVSEQQQEQQRLQHHRQRPHPDRGVPPPPPPSRRQLIFTCVCACGLANHLRHYALGGGKKKHPVASWWERRRGNTCPRYARHVGVKRRHFRGARSEEGGRKKKFAGMPYINRGGDIDQLPVVTPGFYGAAWTGSTRSGARRK